MNTSLSSILLAEISDSSRSLSEAQNFINSAIQKIDEEVKAYQEELKQGISNEWENINIRRTKIEKLLKQTGGQLSLDLRVECGQLEQDIKALEKKCKNIDKEIESYRKSATERSHALLEPRIEKIKDSLTNYIGNAISCSDDLYYKVLNLDSILRDKVKIIDNTSAPKEPTRKEGHTKVGCTFLLTFFLLIIPCFFLLYIPIVFIEIIINKLISYDLIVGVLIGAGFLSWVITEKVFAYFSRKKATREYELEKNNWEIEVKNFKEEKRKAREEVVHKLECINLFLERYRNGDTSVIEEFIFALLEKLPRVQHDSPVISVKNLNSSVIVNYLLPDINDIRELPIDVTIKRGNISLSCFKNSQLSKVYNKLVYDIVLAVMHCVFLHEEVECIESVTVNGILDTVDKSVGKPIRICACSLQMNREEFSELNLELIDSYECFRRFKGIAAANIADKVAVRPIQQIKDKDSRFVEGYCVASELERGTNLATMPWQDFENLIRELFEKLFSKHGGSCKVTRASRDGGVDAVAFNPDPISGGKFIIQAKRYTNLVSPSAVRDLYGTLQHEGANKAILVTTSDYGGDSYSFVKDKPIQLLNGSHLLHYLKEELGMTDVYINLDEAKKLNKEA